MSDDEQKLIEKIKLISSRGEFPHTPKEMMEIFKELIEKHKHL